MFRSSMLVAVSLAGVVLALPGSATAASVTPIADGFAGPLQIAVGATGSVYVAQDFSGVLSRVSRKGVADLVTAPGTEIAGVAALGNGTVFYTTTFGPEDAPQAQLRRVLPNGRTSTVADLGAYEATMNPDQGNTYGFVGITPDCAAQLPPEVGPPSYSGIVDSHPYAVALAPGAVLVADAAGNDILRVSADGSISTVAVLPPQPALVTAEAAGALGLPDCAVGLTYNFEAVPTDVEVGRDGQLYVSLLPGGPEDPSFGARGSVYRVDPSTGASQRIATGFAGATNLALGAGGTIYVSELFADQIAVVRGGSRVGSIPLAQPAAVEYARGRLYASTNVFGNGAVVAISP